MDSNSVGCIGRVLEWTNRTGLEPVLSAIPGSNPGTFISMSGGRVNAPVSKTG